MTADRPLRVTCFEMETQKYVISDSVVVRAIARMRLTCYRIEIKEMERGVMLRHIPYLIHFASIFQK